MRTFARHAGISKSAAQRNLAELAETEHVTRKRRPGGVYVYRIARRFLPKLAPRKLSQARDRKSEASLAAAMACSAGGVPQPGTQKEKPLKNSQGYARTRASFGKSETTGSVYDFDRVASQWKARVEGWVRNGGRFWLAEWGPRPNERGCLAPAALLAMSGLGGSR